MDNNQFERVYYEKQNVIVFETNNIRINVDIVKHL